MPKRKRLKTVDDDLLLKIETAVANGCDTNGQISKAIGWGLSTFKNYRYGKGLSPRYLPFIAPIETAIKKGFTRRAPTMLSLSESAAAFLLRHDVYQERHMETRKVPKRRRNPDAEGGWETVIEESTVRKIIEKQRIPNPLITMFVAVNAAQADPAKQAIGWKSINQVAGKILADEGAIMSRIDEMLDEGEAKEDNPAKPKPKAPAKSKPPKEPKK